ncbi:zinc ABC transporter substrate-binding protein [Candidatus Saccharibacteria bacterium]|nr:zinc ABC transporter substrate-binding protein [Candidatus Saccharibacteria bacterium]
MKKSSKIIIVFVAIMLAIIGAVVGFSNLNKNNKKVSIITTNFPAYDFARAVAGEEADIKMLIKPGAEIHDFEPTPQDIIDIKNSKMFIYTGGESDEWIEDVLDDINTNDTKLFRMMDVVEAVEEEIADGMEHEDGNEEGQEHEKEEAEYDEHVWTSLKNAQKIVGNIKDELVKISPENKDIFESNAEKYVNKLGKIEQEFQNVVKNGSRKTIVFGDRFPLRYFVDDYGLSYFAAFPGCSDQTEASSKTVAFLVDKIKSEKIPVVFKIEMSSGKIADTIANETGAKVLTFNSAHNISADDFKNGMTYAEIMEKNVKALEEALR